MTDPSSFHNPSDNGSNMKSDQVGGCQNVSPILRVCCTRDADHEGDCYAEVIKSDGTTTAVWDQKLLDWIKGKHD